MNSTRPTILTIGHTTHSFDAFVGFLKRHDVNAVADVRSNPYSRRSEQFNREQLAPALQAAGIRYVFLGEELGARRVETECYDGHRAVYRRIAALPKFQEGLARLRLGATQHRVALMCAEKEPLDCHRTILICRALRDEFHIMHILADGATEDHAQTEKRLVREMEVFATLFEPDLDQEQLIEQAYDKRAHQIAYRINEEGVPQ
ncbi:MAG: DUF488 domain-containing protein [Pirellulales bacterium]